MNPAVGTPGRDGADGGTRNAAERGLERILDRAAAGLRLPAEEATAVVLQS
jgi:hypothetical protein